MGECVLCEQHITNPLSPQRLTEQIKTWLYETKPELVSDLDEKADEILSEDLGDTRCIVTGRKMSVCTYCFTEHIFNWLRSLKLDNKMLTDYLTYFHFDGHKMGYWTQAEDLGITP